MKASLPALLLLSCLLLAGPGPAQGGKGTKKPSKPALPGGMSALEETWAAWNLVVPHPQDPDLLVMVLWGGFLLRSRTAEVRGRRAMIFLDKDLWIRSGRELLQSPVLPPTVGLSPPRAGGERPLQGLARVLELLAGPVLKKKKGLSPRDLVRRLAGSQARAAQAFYAEGKVIVREGDVQVLRADRLYMNLQDGSFTAEEARLRLPALTPGGTQAVLVVRAPLVTERGGRVEAENATITYCDYAVPHYYVQVGSLQGWREGEAWVFRTRNNTLRIHSIPVLWIPRLTWRTGDKGPLPLKAVEAGRSSKFGPFLFTVWGQSLRDEGNSLDRALGLPEKGFRGDWTFRTGVSQERGFPQDLRLRYELPGYYYGETGGFWLRDEGDFHKGPVREEWDGGSLPRRRWLEYTENRFFLSDRVHLDIQDFHAGDPGVYPEFYEGRDKRHELPETSGNLVWASGNKEFSLLGRWETTGFSYGDNRALAPSFLEHAPSGRFLWVGNTLADLPWGQRLTWSLEAESGNYRINYIDDMKKSPRQVRRTFAEIEAAGPFSVGAFRFRPYASLAAADYEDVSEGIGKEGTRTMALGGIKGTIHFSRYYDFRSSYLGMDGLVHQVDPEVEWRNRFSATGESSRYPQLDRRDTLDKRQEVIFAFRNRFLTARRDEAGRKVPVTIMRADFWTTLYPNKDRDNGGDRLGLASFEVAWQPQDIPGLPLLGPTLSFEGDYDPNEGRFHTLKINAGAPVGKALLTGGWIKGEDYKGWIYGNASVLLAARWETNLGLSYDLDRKKATGVTAGLRRHEHDWTIGLVFKYDEGENDYQVRFEFIPGEWMVKRRKTGYGALDPMEGML